MRARPEEVDFAQTLLEIGDGTANDSDERNDEIMAMMPVDNPAEDEFTYYSIDSAQSEQQHLNADDYPIEFLHTLSPSGFLFATLN